MHIDFFRRKIHEGREMTFSVSCYPTSGGSFTAFHVKGKFLKSWNADIRIKIYIELEICPCLVCYTLTAVNGTLHHNLLSCGNNESKLISILLLLHCFYQISQLNYRSPRKTVVFLSLIQNVTQMK